VVTDREAGGPPIRRCRKLTSSSSQPSSSLFSSLPWFTPSGC